MQEFTRILTDIDLEREGKQVGHLRVPHSDNDSAWGTVAIPIVIVRNGAGPTLLLTAGVHGDEYEGQIVLFDVARTLEPDQLRGRVILIPSLHLPACQAGTRLSPIDQRDLNRTFPGDPRGTFAAMLSHYVTRILLPLCNVNVDLHSGGRSLECLPSTMSHILDDRETMRRTVALAKAFGAPLHVMNREVDGGQTLQTASEQLGVISMSSELGGGNRVSLDGLAIARRGVINVMRYLEILQDAPAPTANETHVFAISDPLAYGFSPASGIYCPAVPLGANVQAGEVIGHVYSTDEPMRTPLAITAGRAGMLWCQRGQGQIKTGDSAAVVVSAFEV